MGPLSQPPQPRLVLQRLPQMRWLYPIPPRQMRELARQLACTRCVGEHPMICPRRKLQLRHRCLPQGFAGYSILAIEPLPLPFRACSTLSITCTRPAGCSRSRFPPARAKSCKMERGPARLPSGCGRSDPCRRTELAHRAGGLPG